jgi:signal transduction histidine kinase
MKQEIESQQIDLYTQIISGELTLRGDEKLITQVVINLISNSIHALEDKDNGKIELSVYRNEEERSCICVSDNGKGIPAALIDKIFIPFFTTREGGSGIGLSLARQIMHQHNGSIRVTSVPGEKTEFVLKF